LLQGAIANLWRLSSRSFEMGGQGMERREILRYIGIASVAATFPGFSRWAFACVDQHNPATITPTKAGAYKPLFFSPTQYRMVEHLAEMIIPGDDTPGATQAGVAEFIDFMLANRVPVSTSRDIRSTADAIEAGNEAQRRFIAGLGWMNARCQSQFGREFMDCTRDQQTALLEELAYKAKFKPTTESGREFFRMMRDYTVVGYYTTKIGLESLGYPGLQEAWEAMPGCPHPDDPEHLHLRPQADFQASKQLLKGFFLAGKTYDAIVVGTGAGGGTAMKILCEAGLQVCALNAGPRIDVTARYTT
jgi:Gluconate 2-dehydrogenase subunit 3